MSRERARAPNLRHSPDYPNSKVRHAIFWVAYGVKIALGFGLPWLCLHRREAVALTGASVTVWLLALVYERLRGRPPPHVNRLAMWSLPIYAWVGLIYGLRACLGWLGSNGRATWPFLVTAYVCFYLFGLAVVLMGWVLESTTFAAGPAGSEPAMEVRDAVVAKPHVWLLGVLGGF